MLTNPPFMAATEIVRLILEVGVRMPQEEHDSYDPSRK